MGHHGMEIFSSVSDQDMKYKIFRTLGDSGRHINLRLIQALKAWRLHERSGIVCACCFVRERACVCIPVCPFQHNCVQQGATPRQGPWIFTNLKTNYRDGDGIPGHPGIFWERLLVAARSANK